MTDRVKRNRSALMILTVGVIFVINGVTRGEVGVVFIKAIRICFECIGIG